MLIPVAAYLGFGFRTAFRLSIACMVRYQKPEQRRPSAMTKVLGCIPCVRSAHNHIQEHKLPKSSPKLLSYLARDESISQTRKLSSSSTCTSPVSSQGSEGEEYRYTDELETLLLSDASDFNRCEVIKGVLVVCFRPHLPKLKMNYCFEINANLLHLPSLSFSRMRLHSKGLGW